ncbi:hypothetical protein KAT92_05425 [Candidatus Babeliales bacterium]|nr:hypothetical protein [Candidatus Babeliales bacterium]
MTIPELIDKQDSIEIIRDQIAAILVVEIANQQVLAAAALKDPDDWKLRIFTERSNPWEQYLNDQSDPSPLVNIWIDNSNYDPKASNAIERQKTSAVYNIDCYGYGMSEDIPAGGHRPGDKEAALEVQKAVRLVRNILMAGENTYLQLRGLVWSRWPQSITIFQPQLDGRTVQQIVGARIAFRVEFNEFSPQVPSVELELLTVDVKRLEDGEIILEADYEYPLP